MKGARIGSWRVTRGMREESANRDGVIAKIAARQHGVVSSRQLVNAGVDKDGITRRVHAGRLHRLHRGVYAVGHIRLSFEGRCAAAVLACGEGAVASHRSAAALWGMLPHHNGPIEITLATDSGRTKRRGIRVHRSPSFGASLSTRRFGIPLTKPPRTLRDLHRTVPQPVYRRAVRRALDLRLIASMDLESDEELTRSDLEILFLRFCRRHQLPVPEVNAQVAGFEVDFLWRAQRLVVETDSFRHHGHRAAFESDRARDARLQSLGYRVLRFTWRQIRETPDEVATALRAVLGLR
jgi:very-short-patch-repair endonuclease